MFVWSKSIAIGNSVQPIDSICHIKLTWTSLLYYSVVHLRSIVDYGWAYKAKQLVLGWKLTRKSGPVR